MKRRGRWNLAAGLINMSSPSSFTPVLCQMQLASLHDFFWGSLPRRGEWECLKAVLLFQKAWILSLKSEVPLWVVPLVCHTTDYSQRP